MAKTITLLQALLENNLVQTKDEALKQVLAGNVVSANRRFTSLAERVGPEDVIRLKREAVRYVSRGGDKLESVFGQFNLSCEGLTGLDAGASTGGFTDFCLQQGARSMIAVDVGYGILDHKLRVDPRVISIERTNIRTLEASSLDQILAVKTASQIRLPVNFIVGDLSFISLRLIVPRLLSYLKPGGWMILLIKPQFEAETESVPEGGIIYDQTSRDKIIDNLLTSCRHLPMETIGLTPSGVKGRTGNQEYFWGVKKL